MFEREVFSQEDFFGQYKAFELFLKLIKSHYNVHIC